MQLLFKYFIYLGLAKSVAYSQSNRLEKAFFMNLQFALDCFCWVSQVRLARIVNE